MYVLNYTFTIIVTGFKGCSVTSSKDINRIVL